MKARFFKMSRAAVMSSIVLLLLTSHHTPAQATFDAGTSIWTPKRDANGIVTQASWNDVPLDTWVEVKNTALNLVSSAVYAAMPGYREYANAIPFNGITAYCGIALDSDKSIAYTGPAGGHGDGANNGNYAWNFLKMVPFVHRMPTDLTNADPAYIQGKTGSFGIYPPANNYSIQNPDSQVWWDELYPLAPGEWTARHTYSSMLIFENKLYMWDKRLWILDLLSNKLSCQFPLSPDNIQYTASTWSDKNGETAETQEIFVDKVRRQVYCTPTFRDTPGRTVGYDIATKKLFFPKGPNAIAGGYISRYMATTQVGQKVWAYIPTMSPSLTSRLWLTNLDKDSVEYSAPISFPPGITFSENGIYDWGLAHIPEKNLLMFSGFFMRNGVNSSGTFWIDPVTKTAVEDKTPGNYYPKLSPLVENKIFYVPGIKAVIQINSGIENIRMMRVSNDPLSSIKEEKNDLFMTVTPNPSTGSFLLESKFEKTGRVTISLVNVLGETVITMDEIQGAGIYSKQINTEQLPKGIYFLVVQQNNQRLTKKIVIE